MSAGLPVPGELLLAVDHVGVAVPDLGVALTFYTEVLGLELLHQEVNAEQGVAEAMLAPFGSSAESAQVQLLAPLTPASPIARFLDRAGPGLQQIAYRVRDIDVAAQELRHRGLRLLYDEAKVGTRGSRVNFVHPRDAGGVLIELVETAARGERSGRPRPEQPTRAGGHAKGLDQTHERNVV